MNNQNFTIQQFEDKPLSHYAYAIVSQGQMILIDPSRNPQPYYDYAKQQNAKIAGVIETHPHADFVFDDGQYRYCPSYHIFYKAAQRAIHKY